MAIKYNFVSKARRASFKKIMPIVIIIILVIVCFCVFRLYFFSTQNVTSDSGSLSLNVQQSLLNYNVSSSTVSSVSLPGLSSSDISGSNLGLAPNIIDSSLFFGTYFDTFANEEFVSLEKTNLYYDSSATAYFFAPNFTFEQVESALDQDSKIILQGVQQNIFEGPYSDKRCLKNQCLEQKGSELFFNDKRLSLPAELKKTDIVAVSLGSLTKRWLVGITIKNADSYEGLVYYFDGQKFARLVTPKKILSPYFGVLGFGGGENNFLVIYGAYQGIAYHFYNDNIFDISRFFDIRVMNGGFKAEVLFTAFEDNIDWYVYSSTLNRPTLIKLWQNGGAQIAGEMIPKGLFQDGDESAVFTLNRAESTAITLLAKIRRNNSDSWFYFKDYGFKNEVDNQLISVPLAHDGYISSIEIVKVAQSHLAYDPVETGGAELLFSTDGQTWQKLSSEPNTNIAAPTTQYFYLKVFSPKLNNRFYSPFISEILFNYYCRK